MMRTPFVVRALALAALLPAIPSARADGTPPPDAAAKVTVALAELDAAVKAKDDAAVANAVKRLPPLFKDSTDGPTRVKIAKELGDLVKQTKLPTARSEALKALVETGDGVNAWKGLAAAYPADDVEDKDLFNAEIVKAVGDLHPEAAIDRLLTTFQKAKQAELSAAAALALGSYRKSKRREAILEELVKTGKNMIPAKAGKAGANPSEDALKRWGVIGQGIGKGLDNLTGQNIGEPAQWFKKYDESKKNVKALFRD